MIKISDVPENRRLIGSKWVFKVKRDGRYRSRLVILGYTQIPGTHFTDSFSPVVSNSVLRIMLIVWMTYGLKVDQIDVETAFLEGDLKPSEYIYMKCPYGLKLQPDECLEIRKGMYGLVQSMRIFLGNMSNHLCSEEMGFTKCEADQCLFYKTGKKGPVMIILYVDDLIVFGMDKDIKDVIKGLRKKFNIKTEGKLNNFLGY